MKLSNTNPSEGQLIFFLLGALTVLFSLVPEASKQGFLWLNQVARVVPDTPLAIVTNWGNGITVGCFWLMLLCCKPSALWKVLSAIAVSALMLNLLKNGFDAMRPAALLNDIRIVGATRLSHSLPSAHTGTVFALLGIAWHLCHRNEIKFVMLLAAVLVGLSRITNGAHWPQDVALGAWVGWSSARFAWHFVPECRLSQRTILGLLAGLYIAVWYSALQARMPFPNIPLVAVQLKLLLLLPLFGLYRMDLQLRTGPRKAPLSVSG
ncbi:phosphatase PAP2 family protein [Shewanella sp.]|uniref:phosphatase PAP2 family protein n=1 Tax=Shewanella sp. TaxID=50422 RepID=UPI003568E2DD